MGPFPHVKISKFRHDTKILWQLLQKYTVVKIDNNGNHVHKWITNVYSWVINLRKLRRLKNACMNIHVIRSVAVQVPSSFPEDVL
jgi:hypothetical protein